MSKLDELRQQLAAATVKRDKISEDLAPLTDKPDLTPGEQQRFERLLTGYERASAEVVDIKTLMRGEVAGYASRSGITTEAGSIGQDGATSSPRASQTRYSRTNGTPEHGEAMRALDSSRLDAADGDRVARAIDESPSFAFTFPAAADPSYESAFLKMLANPVTGQLRWTSAERAAWDRMQESEQRAAWAVGSSTASSGLLAPTHLDPSIILTSSGWTNPLREISRHVDLNVGNVWNGVTSAGVTASIDAENAEVSDDTPDLARASIPLYTARAFVEYSVESEEDIASLFDQVRMLMVDAKGDLEASKFANGTGTNEPQGVWTGTYATTASRVTSTTAATIGEVDIHALYRALPVRHRRRATWTANPTYALAVKRLGTAVSSSFSGDLTQAPAEYWLNHRVVEDDDAPATQTTTALDQEVLFGDFSQFVIVDKPGSMRLELVPHLLGSNRRPTLTRGVIAWWRFGSGVVNADAFRVLVDKTSA